jgi:hypothetical protein
MTGCVLRAGGVNFSPGAFLMQSPLVINEVLDTAIHISISSKAGNDLYGQIVDALNYLQVHAEPLRHLATYPDIDNATLDFCIWRQRTPAQSLVFPPQLIDIAGRLGLGLATSIYDHGERLMSQDNPQRKVVPFPLRSYKLTQITPTAL